MLENFQPTVLRVFGGLCTFVDRLALALGASPDCRNAKFGPGVTGTRDGYGVILTDEAQPFNGVTQLVRPNGDRHTIILTDNGQLKAEFPAGTLTVLDRHVRPQSQVSSATLFGSRYLCFSDGRTGTMPMYRYNGATASLVGAGSPGKAPTMADAGAVANGLLAGVHCAVAVFVNKAGDISGWSPVASITLASDNRSITFGVPLGPPDTVQRIVAITPRNDGRNFLYTARTIINDNTTSSITPNISEQELLESTLSARRYVSSFVPWMPIGCMAHQERLFVWGDRATLQPTFAADSSVNSVVLQNIGLRNLAFDGGFTGNIPNGWTAGIPAGWSVGGDVGTPFYGKCYRILGDGVALTRGAISQTVRNNESYMRPQGRYGVAVLMRSPFGTAGNLCVDVSGAGPVFLQARFPCGGVDADGWAALTYEMAAPLATDEISLTVQVYWSGVAPMGVGNWVDCKIALYDADDLQYAHTFSASDAANPGTFVGETCDVSVGADDGEGIRNIFRVRDSVYIAKERSLHSLTSSGAGEPTTWATSLVDPYAGTPSLHGVAAGTGFALIANRDGLYLFDGAAPRLVSREIEPTWRGADWLNGHRAILVMDPAKEVVRAALPVVGDRRGCSLLLTLDFKEGWESAIPSGSGMKWATDTFRITNTWAEVMAGALILSSSGTSLPALSIYGGHVQNRATSTDFSPPRWTFSPGVTYSTGYPDGRSGNNYATKWVWSGSALTATYVGAVDYARPVCVVSFRIHPIAPTSISVTVTSTGWSDTTTATASAGAWTRVVAYFYSNPTHPPGGLLNFAVVIDGSVGTYEVELADMQIDWQAERADWGHAFAGNGQCGLLVAPAQSLRRDFAGRIQFRYDTAPFGADAGRSTFDRAVLRAAGEGYLAATYRGVGVRSWDMIPVQLAPDPDEDVEYGANLHAPAAGLSLTTTSEDGWVVLRRIVVAAMGEKIGWLRGRNG